MAARIALARGTADSSTGRGSSSSSSFSAVCPPSPRDSEDLPSSPSSSVLDEGEEEEEEDGDQFHDCRTPTEACTVKDSFAIINKPLHAQEPVFLNVYDLVDVEENVVGRMSGALGLGLHHCGVELYSREWSFCGTIFPEDRDETGVFWTKPHCAVPHFRTGIPMGCTMLTETEVRRLLALLRVQWFRGTYHILHRNCNHFAELLVRLLVGERAEFPGWVNRAARVGDLLLPEKLINFFVEAAHERMRQEVLAEEQLLSARSQPPAVTEPLGCSPMWPAADEDGMNFLDPPSLNSPSLESAQALGLSPVTSAVLLSI
eukprot:GGOE01022096.1.p1 GENE.GGOE01022096.1~~GGOE01022096.1.p1  ORF type:complete len:349 (-),score=80.05 GGOE01022096.1:358-1308(-)